MMAKRQDHGGDRSRGSRAGSLLRCVRGVKTAALFARTLAIAFWNNLSSVRDDGINVPRRFWKCSPIAPSDANGDAVAR